jgi:hypothetical protein
MLKHWIGRWARFSSVGETHSLNSEQGKAQNRPTATKISEYQENYL